MLTYDFIDSMFIFEVDPFFDFQSPGLGGSNDYDFYGFNGMPFGQPNTTGYQSWTLPEPRFSSLQIPAYTINIPMIFM